MSSFLPLLFVVVLQALLAIRLFPAFGRVFQRRIIPPSTLAAPVSVSVLIPVLNEESRLPAMLEALVAEARAVPEITEILIIDGGSSDGTRGVVDSFAVQDHRLAFVDVSPVPVDAVGKAWGLLQGTERACGDWILTLDADTIVAPGLTRLLLAFAMEQNLDALSVASRQACTGWLQSMLHPSLLTTLVYRFGPPGYATRDWRQVMANGQCFLASRSALRASGAIGASLSSLSEDITMARTLANTGHVVGFFEADVPVEVQMYASAREVWANWPRSLVMRDQFQDWRAAVPFGQLALLQAAPLPLLIMSLLFGLPVWFALPQAVFLMFRVGVLVGVRSGYSRCAPTYWLSPLLDVPVLLRLLHAQFQRRLVWRGRAYARSPDGTVKAVKA